MFGLMMIDDDWFAHCWWFDVLFVSLCCKRFFDTNLLDFQLTITMKHSLFSYLVAWKNDNFCGGWFWNFNFFDWNHSTRTNKSHKLHQQNLLFNWVNDSQSLDVSKVTFLENRYSLVLYKLYKYFEIKCKWVYWLV